MSDLVMKVVNEIAICRKSGGIKCEQVCDYCKEDATRAIKAVADWLHDQHWHAANDLRRALEGSE